MDGTWIAIIFVCGALAAAVCVRAIAHAAEGLGAVSGRGELPQSRTLVRTVSGLLIATALAVLAVLIAAFVTVVNRAQG
jgi:hypothetical protein